MRKLLPALISLLEAAIGSIRNEISAMHLLPAPWCERRTHQVRLMLSLTAGVDIGGEFEP